MEYVCPKCKSSLVIENHRYSCASCNLIMPEVRGIPVLLSDTSEIDSAIYISREVSDSLLMELSSKYHSIENYNEPIGVSLVKSNYCRTARYIMKEYVKWVIFGSEQEKRADEDSMRRTETIGYGGVSITAREILLMKEPSVVKINGKRMLANDNHIRKMFHMKAKEFLTKHSIPNPKEILEVGCGALFNFSILEQLYPLANLYGLDYNINRLIMGEYIFGNKHDICCGTGFELPYSDDSFDLVLTMHVMERFGDMNLDRLLKEINRITRYLVAIEPIYEHQDIIGKMYNRTHQYPSFLAKRIRNMGFTVLEEFSSKCGTPYNLSTIILLDFGQKWVRSASRAGSGTS